MMRQAGRQARGRTESGRRAAAAAGRVNLFREEPQFQTKQTRQLITDLLNDTLCSVYGAERLFPLLLQASKDLISRATSDVPSFSCVLV